MKVRAFPRRLKATVPCPLTYGLGIHPLKLVDPKGGDLEEIPEDLRVREFPAAQPK